MTTAVTIDYEQLVADYLNSLHTVLRGFDSGAGNEFLATWVYDEDPLRSLLGVIEAAREAGLPQVTIRLGQTTVSQIDLSELTRQAAGQGETTLAPDGAGQVLQLQFAPGNSVAPTPSARRTSTGAGGREARLRAGRSPVASTATGADDSSYARALREAGTSGERAGEATASPSQILVRAVGGNITLTAAVDRQRHEVVQARYQGAATAEERGLWEQLCAIMEGRPILECADHGVVRLEFELRVAGSARPVPGIVLPGNASSRFTLPTQLVRALLAAYRQQTGYASVENFYDPPVTPRWRACPPAQRLAEIATVLRNEPAAAGMLVVELETPKRVVVEFAADIPAATKQPKLMAIEAALKRSIDPNLQVYVQQRLDENKLRRIKELAK